MIGSCLLAKEVRSLLALADWWCAAQLSSLDHSSSLLGGFVCPPSTSIKSQRVFATGRDICAILVFHHFFAYASSDEPFSLSLSFELLP
jgi:hypothetical protein